MSQMVDDVNRIWQKLDASRNDFKEKGVLGEQAVFRICEEVYRKYGGILYHSFTYKVDPEKAGNIKRREDGKLYVENLGSSTEIDILLVTPYRIFSIEVKTYSADTKEGIVLTDAGISGCFKTDKSPVHQNEMHCRHLYSHVYRCIPDGDTGYIVPIVCFVDKCGLKDSRSSWQKEYVQVTTLNGLHERIMAGNRPCGYRIDLGAVDRALTECCVGYERLLPLRKERGS